MNLQPFHPPGEKPIPFEDEDEDESELRRKHRRQLKRLNALKARRLRYACWVRVLIFFKQPKPAVKVRAAKPSDKTYEKRTKRRFVGSKRVRVAVIEGER